MFDGITKKEPGKLDGIHLGSADCDRWEAMIAKRGAYGVAKKMVKTKAWRDYVQKWPFDYIQTRDSTVGSDEVFDTLADDSVSLVHEIDIKMRYGNFVDSLSSRELQIWRLYEEGKNPAEIMDTLGYNTTNAVRWHKHNIKKKWVLVFREGI